MRLAERAQIHSGWLAIVTRGACRAQAGHSAREQRSPDCCQQVACVSRSEVPGCRQGAGTDAALVAAGTQWVRAMSLTPHSPCSAGVRLAGYSRADRRIGMSMIS
jgi:hypothetical protein